VRIFKVFLISALFLSNPASAAPIKITQIKPSFYIPVSTPGDQINNLITSPISIFLGGTMESTTSGTTKAYLGAFDWNGVKQWEFFAPVESMGSDIGKDNLGNLYLFGLSVSNETSSVSISPDTATLNPDNVQIESTYSPNNELKILSVWKISSSGQLAGVFTQTFPRAVFTKNIRFDGKVFILSGYQETKYFELNMGLDGTLGKITYPKEIRETDKPLDMKFGTNKLSYFISKSAILGIPSWKPKRALPVLIERSKFGAIKNANYFAEKVISTAYQRNLAFTLLSESTLGFGISIVRPLR